MAKMATIDQVIQSNRFPGLSRHELYTGLKSGKYPGFRIGGQRGKFIVDLELLDVRIKEMMLENMNKNTIDASVYGKLRKIQK